MAKKGLTKKLITEAALKQISETGLADFSLRTLAAALDVRVSSLYNHISGYNELLTEVGLMSAEMLAQCIDDAVRGLHRRDALFALADAYMAFAREHTRLYRIIMGIHNHDIPILETAAERIAMPILRVLSEFGIDKQAQIHYQRMLRSVMHGFFVHESISGFPVSAIDSGSSYRFAIECITAQIESQGGAALL